MAGFHEAIGGDSPEQISACLTCPRKECRDPAHCDRVKSVPRRKTGRPLSFDPAKAEAELRAGKTLAAVAAALQVHYSTLKGWAKANYKGEILTGPRRRTVGRDADFKHCVECVYFWFPAADPIPHPAGDWGCNYLAMEGRRRPCPAGAGCTVRRPGRDPRTEEKRRKRRKK